MGISPNADNLQTLLLLAFFASLVSDLPTFVKRNQNRILTVLFILFAVAALFALPYEPEFNAFTPRSVAYTQIGTRYYSYLVYVSGRGGISAGNPIYFNVTAFTNQTQFSNYVVDSVYFMFNASYAYPPVKSQGIFTTPTFMLGQIGSNVWTRTGQIIYYHAGDYAATIFIHSIMKNNSLRALEVDSATAGVIQVSSEDVTVLAKTNAYLLSLSFAFLSFVCLELRIEEHRKSRKTRQHDYTSTDP